MAGDDQVSETWLVRSVCRLAAELVDELDRNPDALKDVVEVELRVACTAPIPGARGVCDQVEYIRRTRSIGGEWGGTERLTREHFV